MSLGNLLQDPGYVARGCAANNKSPINLYFKSYWTWLHSSTHPVVSGETQQAGGQNKWLSVKAKTRAIAISKGKWMEDVKWAALPMRWTHTQWGQLGPFLWPMTRGSKVKSSLWPSKISRQENQEAMCHKRKSGLSYVFQRPEADHVLTPAI